MNQAAPLGAQYCRCSQRLARDVWLLHAERSCAKNYRPNLRRQQRTRGITVSNLAKPNGDDYPEAARRHLVDAETLLKDGRAAGAAYLSGYVVECSLKSLLVLEGTAAWGHGLPDLASQVMAVNATAGAKSARYITDATKTLPTSAVMNWSPSLRYQAPNVDVPTSAAWVEAAKSLYMDTVAEMWKDGVA